MRFLSGPRAAALVVLAAWNSAEAATLSLSRSRANPIRKVVNLLKKMEEKADKEGEESEEMFEKYMCYCKTTLAQLEAQVTAANDKMPQVESSIKETQSSHDQLKIDLATHKKERAAAKEALETGGKLREKAAATFASQSTEMQTNIKAMDKAVAAISKGTSDSFLQTKAAASLRKISLAADMPSSDRDLLVAFLSEDSSGKAQSEGSGEIVGILKQMKEDMQKDLDEMTETETTDIANYESLVAAKKKEIAASTKDIEEKTGRVGELAVELATLKDDLEDTKEALEEDKTFQGNLAITCKNKKEKYTGYTQRLSMEKVALAETIKLLNDDDALELFKKTLPSASASSFIQIVNSGKEEREEAAQGIAKHRRKDPRMALLVMALRGEKKGFEEVAKKVDELMGVLSAEQTQDDKKKAFCEKEIDKTEDEQKVEERLISDRETIIAEAADTLSALKEEIAALVAGIKKLDAEVDEQTKLRKSKAQQVTGILAGNNAAKQLLEMAKKRLNKFYNPKIAFLQKSKAKKVQEDDEASSDDAAPSFLQEEADETDMDTSEAESYDAANDENYMHLVKQTEEAGGVTAMIDMLIADIAKETTALEMQDAQAQKDYENFVADSAAKRMIDSKAISDKEGMQAELEEKLHKNRQALRGEKANLQETLNELRSLHLDCDWLAQNYELRKNAREDEKDSLEKAKAVLSGADYS